METQLDTKYLLPQRSAHLRRPDPGVRESRERKAAWPADRTEKWNSQCLTPLALRVRVRNVLARPGEGGTSRTSPPWQPCFSSSAQSRLTLTLMVPRPLPGRGPGLPPTRCRLPSSQGSLTPAPGPAGAPSGLLPSSHVTEARGFREEASRSPQGCGHFSNTRKDAGPRQRPSLQTGVGGSLNSGWTTLTGEDWQKEILVQKSNASLPLCCEALYTSR